MVRVGLLAGTGFSHAEGEALIIETPFGDVEARHLRDGPLDLFLVARHGSKKRPAHRVNHRANLDALARCKVDAILALHSVGALRDDIPIGSLLVPHDVLDMRPRVSFHDDAAVHIDFSHPFCPDLRQTLLGVAGPLALPEGVYAATEGPRLESPAEVRALRMLGGDVVGMTAPTEASLARERSLCYASLCLVTNPAAGVGGAASSAAAIRQEAARLGAEASRIARTAATAVAMPRTCGCARALDEARI